MEIQRQGRRHISVEPEKRGGDQLGVLMVFLDMYLVEVGHDTQLVHERTIDLGSFDCEQKDKSSCQELYGRWSSLQYAKP